MKKRFFFTVLPMLLFWSYAATDKSNGSAKTNSACETIELKNNTIWIRSGIETAAGKFMVDFGSATSLIRDAQVGTGLYKRQNSQSERTAVAAPSVLKNRKRALHSKNNLFEGEILFNLNPENSFGTSINCLIPEAQGLYGFDVFNQKTTICHLDFDASTICNLTENEFSEKRIKENYKPIKANFNGHAVSIFITINRKEYEFLFDTGFSGTFNIPFHKNMPFLKENHQTFESVSGSSERENPNTTVMYVYQNKSVSLDGVYYSTDMTVSNSFSKQRMGMGFIKGFNWIIDNGNRKVYIKKNTLSLDTGNFKKDYSVQIQETKLVIHTINAASAKFSLGAVLVSVNDMPITRNNVCEMQHLLNETADWTTLKIETEKATN